MISKSVGSDVQIPWAGMEYTLTGTKRASKYILGIFSKHNWIKLIDSLYISIYFCDIEISLIINIRRLIHVWVVVKPQPTYCQNCIQYFRFHCFALYVSMSKMYII